MKDLEFLPQHHIRARQNIRLRSVRLLLLTALAMAMICWTVFADTDIERAEVELEQIQTRTASISSDISRLEQLEKLRKVIRDQQQLVQQLNPMRGRSDLIRDLSERLPSELVLTRLDIEVQQQAAKGAAPAGRRQRGAKTVTKVELADRLDIEGFAADDLALARFLQEMTEPRATGLDGTTVTSFRRGELSFTRDAEFRDKTVRVFRARFEAAGSEASDSRAGLNGGRR